MARPIANVNVNHDMWFAVIERVNEMAFTFTNYAVTLFPNTAGAVTSGNGSVIGNFGSTTLFATTALRGGTVTQSANLAISSNVVFNGALAHVNSNTVFVGATTNLSSANTTVDGQAFVIGAGTVSTVLGQTNLRGVVNTTNAVSIGNSTLTVTSNTTFTNDTTVVGGGTFSITSNTNVSGLAAFSANVSLEATTNANILNVGGLSTFSDVASPSANNIALGSTTNRWRLFATNVHSTGVYSTVVQANTVSYANTAETMVVANNNMGANVSTAQTIMTLPRTSFRSGQLKFQIKGTTGYQHCDASFVHDDNDVYMSVYGTVVSNNELVDLSAIINGANIEFKVKQNIPNLDVRVIATVIK